MACCDDRGRRVGWCGLWPGVAAVLVLLLMVSSVTADWENDCPTGCKCTYSSNRKMADCEEAGFSTVPAKLSSEVQELNLNKNNIIYLEKDAFKKAGLVNLQKLHLQGNGIRTVHKDAFRELGILIELDLQRNNIDKIHPHTFTGLGKLRKLDLSNNQLSRLDGVQFPVLPHLRKLYLNNNNLNYIHNYAFTNLHLLDSLKLAENQLKLIQRELFTNNSKLVDLVLHGNLWDCDCRLKPIVSWVKQNNLLQEHVACHSPERVSGRRWEAISDAELACRPQFREDMAKLVPAAMGQNATITCRAYGEPLPQFKWVLNGRVLTNMSVIPFSQPEQTYIVHEATEGDERYSQLTVTHMAEHDFTYYTCVADNLAGLVEQNITLVAAVVPMEGDLKPAPTPDLYIIIGIVAGAVVLILICTVCICCCIRRRSDQHTATAKKSKLNGSAGGGGNFEHKNVLIVNPVEKPPRQYEQVPQTDLEMSTLVSDSGHPSFDHDNVDYPGDPSLGVMPNIHRGQLPLATLEEEDDDLQNQDTTLILDSTPGQSVIGDYTSHFPDLLDMARGPRAISPTQLSYHSLAPTHVTPQHGGNDHWRYSYVDPNSAYAQYPVAYVPPTPIQQPRPGYVTLPRRHRTPSWAGETSNTSSIMSPQGSLKEGSKVFKVDPIYDTLGPRTTADGTSRTDLTRPGSRLADPYSPRTPTTPASPPNHLPAYYAPLLKEMPSTHQNSGRLQYPRHGGASSTLPRSTPNLLDGDSSGLSLPYHHSTNPAAHSTMLDSSHPQANSPTPSTASTVRTASPAHRLSTTCPPSSASPLHNGHYTSNESALDSPSLTNNNNNKVNSKNLANLSMDSALSMGSSAPSLILSGTGKKVPPKPPPKPSAKRLSLASNSSEPRKTSVSGGSRVFQDEGPDGTEV
ncbi:unnamed protein product [Meganyctiphanes norvegica]|uniref:Ig-like domain-containing protein n=1 Tax=Meganyctiphanes norvegica TaxID=48144 RepID=A0AAV2PV16_MEGNR